MAIGQEEIGQRIAQARNAADLTQQQLAERIGIETAQTVSRYERGETEVKTKRLRRIAEATGQPLSFFIQIPEEDARPAGLEDQLSSLREELAELRDMVAELLQRSA
jgi:transcriptional regulator with XRE-family HTH domain